MYGLKVLPLLRLLQGAVATPIESYRNVTQGGAVSAAECTATSYGQVENVLRSCKNAVLSNIQVPAGGQLKFDGLKGITVSSRALYTQRQITHNTTPDHPPRQNRLHPLKRPRLRQSPHHDE